MQTRGRKEVNMAGPNVYSVLVTGSNRGIGLELVKHFVRKPNPPDVIFATCRDPAGAQAEELKKMASKHSKVIMLQLEATDPASVEAAAKKAEAHLKGSGLNLLINNAGVMPQSTLASATPDDMMSVYNTNVVGPLLVTQAFLPLLKKAAQGSSHKPLSCSKAALINMSTILGSMEKTPETYSWFPVVSYRCSKADLTVDESVNGIMKVLCNLSEKHHGILLNWEGKTVPW
ncbi:uncharacterized protein LOC102570910 isoform X2 [Alligator mississippiensis]|uniref:uncharacterized protein LOC102570910 isoform X2 n=1 Tax=Alligator mississippiensis TaxID=8496 RepID=UPI0009074707|nr:uncharacterized protein LOC102570910 isoform X2 [Alligator mississippiensis]